MKEKTTAIVLAAGEGKKQYADRKYKNSSGNAERLSCILLFFKAFQDYGEVSKWS